MSLCAQKRLGAPSNPKQRSQTGTMTPAGTRHNCNYRGREQERVNSMSSTVHSSPLLSHVCSTRLQIKFIGIPNKIEQFCWISCKRCHKIRYVLTPLPNVTSLYKLIGTNSSTFCHETGLLRYKVLCLV